jgi:hypothetical protein
VRARLELAFRPVIPLGMAWMTTGPGVTLLWSGLRVTEQPSSAPGRSNVILREAVTTAERRLNPHRLRRNWRFS